MDLPQCSYQIFLGTYTKPITFQLSRHAMVTHQGPPGYIPLPKQVACLAIHEAIHGFPGSNLAQQEQEKLRSESDNFNHKFLEIINEWQSGPEEFFVIAAEAYISEILDIRSHQECIEYLENQNNGMPFSMEIYKKLRKEKPYLKSNWVGYGNWLTNALKNQEFFI